MGDNNQLSFPEEDEDLEALRLAALQSLKRKASNDAQPFGQFGGGKDKGLHFNGSPRNKLKRGKFPRQLQGRPPRNGQFNGWSRNSNLIAVPMITESENKNEKKPDDVPKLILPQDRYCKLEKTPEKTDNLTSKFDRYDNSDDSESDSEDDLLKSEPEEKPDLKRSTSLEALMAELENEIQGVSAKPEEKPKPKPKKKRKISITPPEPDKKPPETSPPSLKENLKPEAESPKKPPQNFIRQRKWQSKPSRRQPAPNYPPPPIHRPSVPPPPEIIPPMAFAPPPVQPFIPFNPMGFDGGVYAPPIFEAPPPQLPPMHVAPPGYERPISPLHINTDAFSTSTMAPLSPRSAAFVMENRAIVEKRKRRSYSRSPSPARFRRSKTPKRSSLSPKRLSKSPKRRSLSPSPVRKVLPPRLNSPKKPSSIYDRLGIKPTNKTETDEEKKKDPKPKEEKEKKEIFDPVLEARRKKFERKEITMTEGVIRLRKPEEEETKKEENAEEQIEEEDDEIDEDALLEGDNEPDDAILLDHKIDSLFSDEESNSDNEGRFKTKQEANQKVPILPFTKLINGGKGEVKQDLKFEDKKKEERPKSGGDRRRRFRSRSPLKTSPKKATKSSKKSEKAKQPIAFSNERKIEIKIRNPAKYEKGGEEKERKVEVAKKEEEENEDVAVESAEDAANANISEGDLRAQLSRKRAERQKHPLPDVVPSRLLQNALQGVGFRKEKKAKIKEDNTDGKLPIHLRLGAANSSEVFGKKSRKHKNKGSQEQV